MACGGWYDYTKKELIFGSICALRDAKQLRIKPVLSIMMRWLYTLPLILIWFYPVVPRSLWRVKQIIRNPIIILIMKKKIK